MPIKLSATPFTNSRKSDHSAFQQLTPLIPVIGPVSTPGFCRAAGNTRRTSLRSKALRECRPKVQGAEQRRNGPFENGKSHRRVNSSSARTMPRRYLRPESSPHLASAAVKKPFTRVSVGPQLKRHQNCPCFKLSESITNGSAKTVPPGFIGKREHCFVVPHVP